jgi:hypothetical protein
MPNETGHETKLNFGKDDNSALLQIIYRYQGKLNFQEGPKNRSFGGLPFLFRKPVFPE